jgi:FkbM family methyltransferase
VPHLRKTVCFTLARTLSASLSLLSMEEVEKLGRLSAGLREPRQVEALITFAKAAVRHVTVRSDAADSGEFELIERAAVLGLATVFDVGANVGDWTRHVCTHSAAATVHAFEIVPETFARLREQLADLTARVRLNQFGLLDTNGEIEVFVSGDSLTSSVHDRADGVAKRKQPCPVRRGGDYARDQGIEHIDFLKIDVEGAEWRVLNGFSEYFDRHAVRIVQFEYNWFAIESHFLLIDFYRFLTRRDYVLGRLTPSGVVFMDYRYPLEDFYGPNYVACHKDDRLAIAALEG